MQSHGVTPILQTAGSSMSRSGYNVRRIGSTYKRREKANTGK